MSTEDVAGEPFYLDDELAGARFQFKGTDCEWHVSTWNAEMVRRDGRMYTWRVVVGDVTRPFVFWNRPPCRDRAAAKASAPTVELANGWERLSAPGAHASGMSCLARGCTEQTLCLSCDCVALAVYAQPSSDTGACAVHAVELGVFASPVTDAPKVTVPFKSSKERPWRIGDVYSHPGIPGRFECVGLVQGDGFPCRPIGGMGSWTTRFAWENGDCLIHVEGPVTDDRDGRALAFMPDRHPEPVVCAHVGCGRTEPHRHGVEALQAFADYEFPLRVASGIALPQWLTDERALMQSAPPTQVLPKFPRSKIERDNAHLRPQFQRSPRYSKGTP